MIKQLRSIARRASELHPGIYVLLVFTIAAVTAQLSQPSSGSLDMLPAGWSLDGLTPIERDLPQIHESGALRVLLHAGATSYQVLGGIEYGFEFELVRAFSEELGVGLEVVLADSTQSAVQWLSEGTVDLIAMPLLATEAQPAGLRYTRPYDDVALVVVTRSDSLIQNRELDGLRVIARERSRGHAALLDLEAKGTDVDWRLAPEQTDLQRLLERVADGEIEAVVAPENLARSVQSYREELHLAHTLEAERPVRWALRSNGSELASAVDAFLGRQRRQRPDGSIARSALHNLLRRKYYSDRNLIRSRFEEPFDLARTGRVSAYDELFQRECARHDVDWRLIASLAFQESRFDPSAVSWAGAVGLMQMIPRTAGRSAEALHDPELNVTLGVRYFRELFDGYSYLPVEQRLRFALAAYNCGPGHLEDARILALQRGWDPNDFEGGVSAALLLLSEPAHHKKARYGYVRGSETVAYVREILRRYERFQRILERAPEDVQTAMLSPENPSSESDAAALPVGLR